MTLRYHGAVALMLKVALNVWRSFVGEWSSDQWKIVTNVTLSVSLHLFKL